MKKMNYINEYAYKSDIGKLRLVNQDQIAVIENDNDDVLMIIADGMGGHNKGDYAAKLAVDSIKEKFLTHKKFINIIHAYFVLNNIVSETNKEIYHASLQSPLYKGMGTTLALALILKKKMLVINIGDSRCYQFTNFLKQLSIDESYVDYLKRSGQISEEESNKREDKNILMNALGIYPTVSFVSKIYKYENQDIMLCTDGLYNSLKESDVVEIIKENNPKNIVEKLVNKANSYGGYDNISVAFYRRINK